MLSVPSRVSRTRKQYCYSRSGSQSMFRSVCNVLLIEDNPINVKLIDRLLCHSEHGSLAENCSFNLTCAQSLTAGLEQLDTAEFDVVLLDLMLPDSEGLDTLLRILAHSPKIPVVVQTGNEDETLVVKAFQLGAHGYLPKQNLDSNLLVYAIRLAIERRLQIARLEATQKQQEQDLELQGLEQLANAVRTSVTARMFGSGPLQQSLPDMFEELVQSYGNLMDLALEQQTYKVEHHLSEKLRALAEKLGVLKSSPRDVVDIHTQALRQKTQDVTLAKAQAYVTEGRLMVLELMGYLTSYYRKYYIGLSNINISQKFDKFKQQ